MIRGSCSRVDFERGADIRTVFQVVDIENKTVTLSGISFLIVDMRCKRTELDDPSW